LTFLGINQTSGWLKTPPTDIPPNGTGTFECTKGNQDSVYGRCSWEIQGQGTVVEIQFYVPGSYDKARNCLFTRISEAPFQSHTPTLHQVYYNEDNAGFTTAKFWDIVQPLVCANSEYTLNCVMGNGNPTIVTAALSPII